MTCKETTCSSLNCDIQIIFKALAYQGQGKPSTHLLQRNVIHDMTFSTKLMTTSASCPSTETCFCHLPNMYWIELYCFPGSKIKFWKLIYIRSLNRYQPLLSLRTILLKQLHFQQSLALWVNCCRKLLSTLKMSTCRPSCFGPISSLSLSSLSAGWQMFFQCPTFFISPRPPCPSPLPRGG